ncbi:Kinesin-like protein KIN-14R [Linum perenne]
MEDLPFSYRVSEAMLSGSSCFPQFGNDVNSGYDSIESAVDNDDAGKSLVDSMLCDSNSRLVPSGFSRSNCSETDEVLMIVNSGNESSVETDSTLNFVGDRYYEGGTVLQTDEDITDAGDFPFVYKSARFGNFCYRFHDLPPGDYFVDLHFAEIINTNGPKGIRVFDVFIQDDKVLSEFDIFSIVGANKPLQLVDVRVSVKEDGILVLRFEGLNGSPMLNAICIRKATEGTVPQQPKEYLRCNHCASEIEVSSAQKRLVRTKVTDKYEKRIQDLTADCQRKTNECHEAWMSLTAANEQLEKVRMELDNKTYETRSLDQTVGEQAENLRNITTMYGRDKKSWSQAINNMQEKIKIMKEEHIRLSRDAHGCIDSIPKLNKMVAGVQALVAQCEDLKLKYSEEQAKRKQLYNQIQETKGNIRVFCRCRPLSTEEASTGYATVVDFDSAKDGDLGVITGGSNKKIFKFDRVYTPKDGQVDVFADASPMVVSVLDGYNVCIFAYGQTGTGKTFTMEGPEHNRGVNYRTLEQLFTVARERNDSFTYNISVSVLEVYNEQIRDLLTTSPTSKKLEIKQTSEGSHHVPGVVEAKVDNIKDVWRVLQAGSNARAVGSNNVNEHSSRSHCMLCIMVKTKNLMNGECTKSKLWLVDLAGSERLAKTDAQGERLKEAQNINKSLSALGDVIYALATKSSHIPYRNSKLTHLLQDSLGGDSKTLMFVQISPSEHDLSETLSSLNFATRVRGVELGPARKQLDTSEIQRVKALVGTLMQESRSKDESLRKLEENLQNLENKTRGKDHVYKSQIERIRELEVQLEQRAVSHGQSEKCISQLSERLKGREEICNELQQKVKELESKLKQRALSDAETFQQKVREMEKKMNEQLQESESQSFTLQQKIKDLESRLHEKDQNSEASVLHEKIKELEDKLREQEQKLQNTRAVDCIRGSPTDKKKARVRDDELEGGNILKSSNSINRPSTTNGYTMSKAAVGDEVRKKRHSRNGETENASMQACFNDYRGRKSDPPKIARVTRPPPNSTTAKSAVSHKRINRETTTTTTGLAIKDKDRDPKKRIWC